MSKTGIPEWNRSEAGRAARAKCAEIGHSVNLANSQFGMCSRCKALLYPWSRKDEESQKRCLEEFEARRKTKFSRSHPQPKESHR